MNFNETTNRRMQIILGLTFIGLFALLVVSWLADTNDLSLGVAWWLQLAITLTVAALIVALVHCSRVGLLQPVEQIAAWASNIRQGHFGARLSIDINGMESLCSDINRLAEWLDSLVESSDRRLKDKTIALERQSAALKSLYDLAVTVNQVAELDELVKQSIPLLQQIVDADRVLAQLLNRDGSLRLSMQVGDNTEHVNAKLDARHDQHTIKIPLQFKHRVHGNIEVFLKHNADQLPDELTQALFSMGRSIGLAIEKNDQDKESARLFRMEERTHIANELHDSLAQTVTSLRFQVRILDDLLHQDDEAAIWEQMERVEGIMDEAHSELRSLIGYFRAPIDPRGLMPALRTLISRFKTETAIPIFFHNQWGDLALPDDYEMNLVRIIQEALVNIRKHSNADMVRILFRVLSRDRYQVLIEDDGTGIMEQIRDHPPGEHIGLSVIRERAAEFGADLSIESEPGEGTRILVSFSYPSEN